MEQEEADNNSEDDEDKGSESGTGKNKPADK
jgi:hypothetical protein